MKSDKPTLESYSSKNKWKNPTNMGPDKQKKAKKTPKPSAPQVQPMVQPLLVEFTGEQQDDSQNIGSIPDGEVLRAPVQNNPISSSKLPTRAFTYYLFITYLFKIFLLLPFPLLFLNL